MSKQTDRQRWAEPPMGLFSWSIAMQQRREALREGLQAFAAAWFDMYTDETDLPDWWDKFIQDAWDVGLDNIDLPGREDEDYDDEDDDVTDDTRCGFVGGES